MTSKTDTSEYLKFRVQIRTAKETSPLVNGGHYMTRGHVILCMLYIKMNRMSRNILEPKKERFRVCKTPSPRCSTSIFLTGKEIGFIFATMKINQCVFFDTQKWFSPRPFCPGFLPHPREIGESRETQPEGSRGELLCNMLFIIVFHKKSACPAPDVGRLTVNDPSAGAVIAATCAYLFTAGAFRTAGQGKIGA